MSCDSFVAYINESRREGTKMNDAQWFVKYRLGSGPTMQSPDGYASKEKAIEAARKLETVIGGTFVTIDSIQYGDTVIPWAEAKGTSTNG
jgi:hypothetical protein